MTALPWIEFCSLIRQATAQPVDHRVVDGCGLQLEPWAYFGFALSSSSMSHPYTNIWKIWLLRHNSTDITAKINKLKL